MEIVIEALKFILPTYCANALPVIFGGGHPIDFGRSFFDRKPIFGKNKTLKGFFAGLIGGTAIGLAESAIFPNYAVFFGFILSLGALFGDLAGAFLKRRIGLSPGELLPVIDQVDFLIGALLFAFFFSYPLYLELVILVMILTPPVHLLTNFVAYKLGLKNNPW